jgi:DNA-binding FadR family transcriptional regulator
MKRRERLHQTLARRLGMSILMGHVQPGDNFGGEVEKSAALGVSRTAYRESMRILVAKGLLESRPKVGTHVTPRERWNLLDPDILGWMFAETPDPRFTRDLFELRGIIEPAAAAFAATRRSPAHIVTMREALDAMAQHGLATHEGQEADQRFHHTILAATCNESLASLASSVGAAVRWTTRFKQRHAANPRDPLPEHIAVFAAIENADADTARVAMEQLLMLALSDMSAHGDEPSRA